MLFQQKKLCHTQKRDFYRLKMFSVPQQKKIYVDKK